MSKVSSAWQKLGKPVLVCDFDGVIHEYRNGFQGVDVYGETVDGAREALAELHKKWHIVIFTTRARTPELLVWLTSNGIECDAVNSTEHNPPYTSHKPIATVYLDDNAWPFMKHFEKETWTQVVKDLNKIYNERKAEYE